MNTPNMIKNLGMALFVSISSIASAQYTKTVYYLNLSSDKDNAEFVYFPDFRCKDVDSTGEKCKEDILTSAHRVTVFETDSFIIELDKYSAYYFKNKSGNSREVFLNYYMNKELPQGENIFVKINSKKNDVKTEFYKANLKSNNYHDEKIGEKEFLIDDIISISKGKFAPSFLEDVNKSMEVKQEGKAILLTVGRGFFPKLIALRLDIIDKRGKIVKSETQLKASENVVFAGDIPKGEYTYKVYLTYGDILREGKISIR